MKKRIIVLMAILVLLLSMVGCGTTDEPVGNDAEPTITETVSNDVVNDVEPTEAPEVEEPTATEAPEIEEPTVDKEPTVTEAPEVEEPVVDSEFAYEFEGIYWLAEDGSIYYYDGTLETVYRPSGRVATRKYEGRETYFHYPDDDWHTYGWCIEDNNLVLYLSSSVHATYSPVSKEQAIEKYPVIGGIMPDTPILEYDFEGVYWLAEDGSVTYYDGTNETIYSTEGSIKTYEYEGNAEYFRYTEDGFAPIWYIEDGNLVLCLGDYSVMGVYTPLTKEQAIERFPIIGGDAN